MENILVDTGVWYAMFDDKDVKRDIITDKVELFELFPLIIPWPTLYETVRTRMAKNKWSMQRFEEYLKVHRIFYLDDSSYREAALELSFSYSLRNNRALSMVDCLLRLILEDINVKVHYFATFNHKDFYDICYKRDIEII